MIFKQSPKVNFLIIGAQKAGTTALHQYLELHPDVKTAAKKELHFFNDEAIYSSKKVDFRIYEKQFGTFEKGKIYGECTPIYLYWKDCSNRIFEYNPRIKLIAVLRNPVDRAFAQWNMEYGRGFEHESFSDAIRLEKERLESSPKGQHQVYSYIHRGMYARQIERYKKLFPDNQLLFVKYEDFRKNQETTLNQVFDFLGLDHSIYQFKHNQIHSTQYNSKLTMEDRQFLLQEFAPDIKRVEKLLNWNCADWLK